MKLRDIALDVLFPCVRCMVCGGSGQVKAGVCAACREKMERYPMKDVCAVCGKAAAGRGTCPDCREEPPAYTAARAVFVYEGPVRALIHRMKFRGEYELPVRVFAEEMARALHELGWSADCITAVPVTRKTLRRRGYNQAEKLGKRLTRLTNMKLERHVLEKKRGTKTQVGLSAKERRENLNGAILAGSRSEAVRGKRVLLLDDVYTTGSTAQACAKALRECGAEEVYVLCIARVAEHALEDYLAGKME